MRKLLSIVVVAVALAIPAPSDAAWVRREFRILDLNISGREQQSVWASISIAWFMGAQAASHGANVVTLQEVCASQFPLILAGLKTYDSSWTGTYKNFGDQDGCPTRRHGLAIFTRGVHSQLDWWYLSDRPDLPASNIRWWGLMKVRYRGADIFNTHVMNSYKQVQIPEVDAVVSRSPFFLLAGDFNTRPGEPLIDAFYAKWFEVDADREYTHPRWPSFDPKKIDYIWTNRQPTFRWGDVVDAFFSGHRMVKGIFVHWIWIPDCPLGGC